MCRAFNIPLPEFDNPDEPSDDASPLPESRGDVISDLAVRFSLSFPFFVIALLSFWLTYTLIHLYFVLLFTPATLLTLFVGRYFCVLVCAISSVCTQTALEPLEAELFRDEQFRRENAQQLNELLERRQVLTLLMQLLTEPAQLGKPHTLTRV